LSCTLASCFGQERSEGARALRDLLFQVLKHGDDQMRKLSITFAAALCLLAPGLAFAQNFKAPIRLIVPYAAGGGADALARFVAPGLQKELGQTVIVENKPGAGGQIGTQFVPGAAADGTVLLLTPDPPLTSLPFTSPNVKYDAATDFAPLGQVARTPWTLNIPATAPYKDFNGYAEALKREKGLRSYGVPLTGGAMELIGTAIGKQVGGDMVIVPFNGSAPVIQNVIGAQIPAGITGMPEAMAVQKSGKARVVAVTGAERTPLLPDVPTFKELGVPGLEFYTFVGVFAPKGFPPAMAQEFNLALRKTLADPAVVQKIQGLGMSVASTTVDEATRETHVLIDFWKKALAGRN
jgi:tripartite-type tricarboxylate transporter receptor subunit TctC